MVVELEIEFERLEAGELALDAAYTVLEAALDGPFELRAPQIYRALRGWTGRALRSAYSAQELRGWHELLDTAAANLQSEGNWSVRLDAFKELLFERIGMIENRSPAEIVRRRHVAPLLRALADAPTGMVARKTLLDMLNLQQANLSRLSNMLVDAGMVRRHSEGASATLELTASGAQALADVDAAEAEGAAAKVAAAVEAATKRTSSAWNNVVMLEDHRKKRAKSKVAEWAKHDEPLPALGEEQFAALEDAA